MANQEKKSGSGLMLKVGLLCISITMGTQMAISPALPDIMTTFPEKTTTQVETLSTVHSITALIFVLLCPLVSQYLGKKRTVILGLLVAAIAGVTPFVVGTFNILGLPSILVFRIVWLSRLVYGGGEGLVCGLAVSMIGDFFEGDERATLMGVRSSMETLGQVATTALAGVLLALGWQWPFLVYAIIFVLIVLFMRGVPDDTPVGRQASAQSLSSEGVPVTVLIMTALNFLFITVYTGVNVRIPSIVTEGGFGTASQSSLVISVLAFSGMLCGLVFGKVFGVLRGKTHALGALLLAAGCFLCGIVTSLPVMFVAAVLCGMSFPLCVSFLFNRVNDVAPASSMILCTSITISSGFLAGFFSPYVLSFAGNIMGEPAAAPFVPFAVFMVGIAVLSVYLYGKER